MRHDDDEDDQAGDEGDGCHGNHEAFALSGVIVVPSDSTIAIVVSRSIPGATKAVVPAAIGPSISSPVVSPIASPKATQGSLRVPSQCGGNTSKYGNAHHDGDDGHDFEDAGWRRPAVEMLELVVRVVGIGRLGRDVTKERNKTEKKRTVTTQVSS